MATAETPPKTQYKSTVPAVEQAMLVLNCLAESSTPQLTLTEISNRLGIGKSKVYTILNTLIGHDFIRKDPQTKTYQLGLGIVHLARGILNDLDARDLAKEPLKKLATKTDLSAHFGMITGQKVYIVAKEEANQAFGFTIRIGVQHHLTHGAHGKAIVAFMPEDEAELILAQDNLEFYGIDTPVDKERLIQEFQDIRKLGYAVDPRETNPNLIGISSPVFDSSSSIIGCVLLIGTFNRSKVRIYGPLVAETAREIAHGLGFRGHSGDRGPAV